jgi:hypothetical protein
VSRIQGYWTSGVVTIDGAMLSPVPSQQIVNHSPDGFNWSYGGSGPAQLALALLLHFHGRQLAEEHYQDFKWDVIANLPKADFEMDSEQITAWMKQRAY